MTAILSGSSKWRRAAICAGTAFALLIPGIETPLGPVGSTIPAYADDDGDDDDDDGGARGGRSGSGGGEWRTRQASPPDLLRFFKRQFRKSSKPKRRTVRRGTVDTPSALNRRADEIIAVGLEDGQIDTLVGRGFQVRERQALGSLGTELVKLDPPAGQNLEAARAGVRELAPAASVDFNHVYAPNQDSSCGGRPCVAPGLVGWPQPDAAAGKCPSRDITIGLIDTGINAGHDTFRSSRIEVLKLDPDAKEGSSLRHGTAVASLLVGTGASGTPGLLPNARLIAVDAFRVNNRADAYDLARAIDILAGRNVSVINMSLSGPDNAVLARMVVTAHDKRIDMVAAAGNGGPSASSSYPAAYRQVIAVTAVDRNKQAYRRANRGDYIDLAAPGVGVWAAASIKGTRPQTGTSFAAPFVTAAAALAKAQALESETVETILARHAEDLGAPGKDPVFGWGLLNVAAICNN